MSTDEFLAEYSQLTALYLDGRLSEAIDKTETIEKRHPHRTTDVRHARACLQAAAGQATAALATMRSVVETGSWWSPDRLADPDLDPIRDRDMFPDLEATMHARYDRAVRQAMQSDVHIELLGSYTESEALIVALHMYGATSAETATKWRPTADRYAVAVPESPLRNGDGLPCWDAQSVADRAVQQAAHLLRHEASEPLPLVVAGASQGARHAGRIAFTARPPDYVGCLCIVGAPTEEEITEALFPARQPNIRAWFIAGARDQLATARQRTVHEHLQQAGIASEITTIDGMGHAYPEDLAHELDRAMSFLTAN